MLAEHEGIREFTLQDQTISTREKKQSKKLIYKHSYVTREVIAKKRKEKREEKKNKVKQTN